MKKLLLILLCVPLIFVYVYNTKENEKKLKIGDYYQGGIIFHIDKSGEHGLIVSAKDQGTFEWGCCFSIDDAHLSTLYKDSVKLLDKDIRAKMSGANGLAIGDGLQNTIDIINANCQVGNRENGKSDGLTAAKVCYDLVLEGYDDWYLPSKAELNLIIENIGARNRKGYVEYSGIGDFTEGIYWTSSQSNTCAAWTQNFNKYPTNFRVQDTKTKYTKLFVRAIRSF